MNWYKIIIAGNMADYLRSLGASEDIISYVNSIDQREAQFLVNEFRKNPTMNLQQLQNIQAPEIMNPNSPEETMFAEQFPEQMRKWVLVQMRQGRQGFNKPKHYENTKQALVMERMSLTDWYRSTSPNLTDFTIDDAIRTSNDWHHEMAAQGEGGEYNPVNPNLIVHGPSWKDEEGKAIVEWEGWSVQEVSSANDLEVEGNKMSHCVGSEFSSVANSILKVYSLRDPQNDPHVTISALPAEYGGDKFTDVEQIQGYGNSDPKQVYKDMIKNWVTQGECVLVRIDNGIDLVDEAVRSNTGYHSNNLDGLVDDLLNVTSETDEYGLRSGAEISSDDLQIVFDAGLDLLHKHSYHGEYNGDRGLGEVLVDMALSIGDEKHPHAGVHELLEILQHKEEEAEDWAVDIETGIEMPYEEEFETTEEYDKALEEYYEKIANAQYELLPWGWLADLNKTTQEQWEETYKRPWADLWEKETVVASKGNWCELPRS
jgi:hypothetical protein